MTGVIEAHIDTELEAQFNMRALRPDFETGMLRQWIARSAAFRSRGACQLDLAYGPGERDRIDLFPAKTGDSPLLVFFHGGYWQRGDKSLYSFVAEPFVEHGISVVLVNYSLCPAVRVEQIVGQAQRALAWLWRQAPVLSCTRKRWIVAGHSAGAHLAARMMATHWSGLADDLPSDMLHGALLVSGLYDLEPLCPTSLNQDLRMSLAEARAASPLQHPPATNAAQWLAVGGAETTEFHRQAARYARTFETQQRCMSHHVVDGCDHLDVLQALADPAHPFFRDALAFIASR
ncbi:alpha/beta hydrolase [Cupriavidus pinatubonensis]|uniref:N-octanoylanthranilate hydrolase AqdA1 n=1 Tax=Cupriavidus pinatubonensis TaxID=248026 RepID=A0ABM8WF32_9BURK|nr:alpha/beta hydrolase [Cupriavidus pinatubonensis]CAG9165952.1 putative N-octanoylanthranilate hydrolase AqdA1 [Cupriavidus pinatubonensis]